uniref:Uncharacterized protein n=1 Tax=Anas platyrhynchos platyrhynchos TaxID=8840 RepID=A0A493TRN5_ANAPP
ASAPSAAPTVPTASPESGAVLQREPLYNWQATKGSLRERFAFLFSNELLSDVHFVGGSSRARPAAHPRPPLRAGGRQRRLRRDVQRRHGHHLGRDRAARRGARRLPGAAQVGTGVGGGVWGGGGPHTAAPPLSAPSPQPRERPGVGALSPIPFVPPPGGAEGPPGSRGLHPRSRRPAPCLLPAHPFPARFGVRWPRRMGRGGADLAFWFHLLMKVMGIGGSAIPECRNRPSTY